MSFLILAAVAQPRPSLYPTRSSAGALLGQQLASRGYQSCMLLGITPEGVEIAAAAKAAEQLGAREVVVGTPVATQPAADRIRARQYQLVCPSVVMEPEGHPSPYGDAGADAPERLKSIMIAHQAA